MNQIRVVTVAMMLCFASKAQSLRIVNAASLSSVSLAPGSICTIFGTKLTTGVAAADNVKTPPSTLGGATVTIGGAPASLFYVSPTQINAVINPATPAGVQAVVVASATGNQTGSVTINSNAPPGLFSLSGTGTRDGAILNASTFLLGAFGVTASNSSTSLALFATGLNTTVQPVVTIGGVSVQVTFYGAAPCCDGLQQINVMLPPSLAGAGRVPVALMSGGNTSNTVEVVLLPQAGQGEFSNDADSGDRNRELANLAYIPGTSTVLVTDENDDVVRVVDVKAQKVTQVITLPQGSHPGAIAVTAASNLAVVAETGSGKAAIVDLAKFSVLTEIATGPGARAVAVFGNNALVVNGDNDTVSVLSLVSDTVLKTIPVGRGPKGIAADAALQRANVTNEDDGSVSVIDLNTLAVIDTLQLGAAVRPESIALVPGAGIAFIAVPTSGPQGEVMEVNLATGAQTITSANPDRSGGSSDVAFYKSTLYLANQSGGSISVIPFSGNSLGAIMLVKVDLGARALTVDVKDNLLVVSNESTGTLSVVDLATNKVTGKIDAVKTNMDGDDGNDDHSDRNSANAPVVQTLSVVTGKAGSTFPLTVTGVNLTGATSVEFVQITGQGSGNGMKGANDFTVSSIHVNATGTQLTATVSIAASADAGARLVKVVSPNGQSSTTLGMANTFTVIP